MGIPNIDLNNINLDHDFDEGDPDTNILISIITWHIKFGKSKQHKNKISEE